MRRELRDLEDRMLGPRLMLGKRSATEVLIASTEGSEADPDLLAIRATFSARGESEEGQESQGRS